MEFETTVLRFAKKFFAGTLLSRVTGMLRDVALAFCFGSSPEIAAFMVAYRLANLFRRFFGEGTLQSALVPHFEQSGHSPRFYRDVFFSLTIVLAMVTFLSGAGCKAASSFCGSEIPMMMFAMMPGLIFVCLYALNSAVLQCRQSYFLPAMAPACFNAVCILCILAVQDLPLSEAAKRLSLGVTAAFFAQFLMTLVPLLRWAHGEGGWQSVRIFPSEVRDLAKPVCFGLVGVGAAQITGALAAVLARLADPSGPAYLWYAHRVQQLPLALFGIALSSATLPALSRAYSAAENGRFAELLAKSIRAAAHLLIPCTAGMACLAVSGLSLLYGHGNFGAESIAESAACLRAYAIGLFPSVLVLLLANGFYAQKEYRFPMRCSLYAVALNLLLGLAFIFACGGKAASIALAGSLASLGNCLFLAWGMRKSGIRLEGFGGLWRIGLASFAAAVLVWAIDATWECTSCEWRDQLVRFLLEAGAFAGTLLALSYWLGVNRLFDYRVFRASEKGMLS